MVAPIFYCAVFSLVGESRPYDMTALDADAARPVAGCLVGGYLSGEIEVNGSRS